MHSFDIDGEASFDAARHVETILLRQDGGDFSVACWEPGQISPYHCHPEAIEAYLCMTGGGTMRTPSGSIALKPGSLVVHQLGELHEFENGVERSILFRVRYGPDMIGFDLDWRGNAAWRQQDRDADYFKANPPPGDLAPG